MWDQIYDPLNSKALSTIVAALPVVTLLVLIASNKVKAHWAAIIALIVANLVAIFIFTLPAGMSLRASVLGAVTGFFPIGWIILNVIFLYQLTVERGVFQTLQTTIGNVTQDRRLQLLLIAFSFGAFFEGASGFGTPVAVTGVDRSTLVQPGLDGLDVPFARRPMQLHDPPCGNKTEDSRLNRSLVQSAVYRMHKFCPDCRRAAQQRAHGR